MNIKETVELVVGSAVVGLGIGFLIGRREVHTMAAQCDRLIETNNAMQDKCNDLELVNEYLRGTNRRLTEVALKEAIVNDYDVTMNDVEAWAEESRQIVDEMSDEEYEATLTYMRDNEHN